MNPPVVMEYQGISVVRDDLFLGGTKARFTPLLFDDVDEVVYASPAEGGAEPTHTLQSSEVNRDD
jgi:hypothetical protein